MLDERRAERARVAALFPGVHVDPDDPRDAASPPRAVLDAALPMLARSEAGLVVAQLDDLVGELDAVNLPGTSLERANWQRRTSETLEQIAGDDRVRLALDALAKDRPMQPRAGSWRGGRDVRTIHSSAEFGELDEHLFREGRHSRLFDKLGAHAASVDGCEGFSFAVWAPNAAWVEVDRRLQRLGRAPTPLAHAGAAPGIWEGFVPDVGVGERYKFRLASTLGGDVIDKADPFARARRAAAGHGVGDPTRPRTPGRDDAWMATRGSAQQRRDAPISIYEVHLGSWRRDPDDPGPLLTYRELAPTAHRVRRRGSGSPTSSCCR